MHHNLSLLVQRSTFGVIRFSTSWLDQVFKRLVAPARVVRTVFRRCAAEQGGEEVVWIPIVAGPAHHHSLMLTRFGAFQVLAPLVSHDVGFHAHFRPVSLNHLSHAASVRVVWTLNRHCPQVDGEAVSVARLFQQLFGFNWIVWVINDVFVVAPHCWWDQVLGCRASTLINRVDDGLFVHSHGQCLAHFHVIQWFFLNVEGDITHVQTRLLHQVDGFVFLHCSDVSWVRERHNLTFVFLQFGVTHRSVRRDGED